MVIIKWLKIIFKSVNGNINNGKRFTKFDKTLFGTFGN
jgi:hypothetical protein